MLGKMENIMNIEQSHHNYREAVRNANPPVIPYLGVSLKDLTFIEDGNRNTYRLLTLYFRHTQKRE